MCIWTSVCPDNMQDVQKVRAGLVNTIAYAACGTQYQRLRAFTPRLFLLTGQMGTGSS